MKRFGLIILSCLAIQQIATCANRGMTRGGSVCDVERKSFFGNTFGYAAGLLQGTGQAFNLASTACTYLQNPTNRRRVGVGCAVVTGAYGAYRYYVPVRKQEALERRVQQSGITLPRVAACCALGYGAYRVYDYFYGSGGIVTLLEQVRQVLDEHTGALNSISTGVATISSLQEATQEQLKHFQERIEKRLAESAEILKRLEEGQQDLSTQDKERHQAILAECQKTLAEIQKLQEASGKTHTTLKIVNTSLKGLGQVGLYMASEVNALKTDMSVVRTDVSEVRKGVDRLVEFADRIDKPGSSRSRMQEMPTYASGIPSDNSLVVRGERSLTSVTDDTDIVYGF